MNKQTPIDELFASNKQLNVKVNQLTKKVENDNKEILASLKEMNTNLNMLIIQSRKIADKIGENEKTQELLTIYKKNKESIDNNITSINNNL